MQAIPLRRGVEASLDIGKFEGECFSQAGSIDMRLAQTLALPTEKVVIVNIIAQSSAIVALIAFPVASALAANDGSIEISGRITATTCQVEGKPPGSGAATKAVDFGEISAGNLATEGQTAGDRGFQIHIGGNAECIDGAVAKVRFDPASPALDRATGRLNIDPVADAAKNVQIQIANQDGTPINMYTEDSQGATIEGNSAVIPLIARYYSKGKAEKGVANSRVGFQVVYQ